MTRVSSLAAKYLVIQIYRASVNLQTVGMYVNELEAKCSRPILGQGVDLKKMPSRVQHVRYLSVTPTLEAVSGMTDQVFRSQTELLPPGPLSLSFSHSG